MSEEWDQTAEQDDKRERGPLMGRMDAWHQRRAYVSDTDRETCEECEGSFNAGWAAGYAWTDVPHAPGSLEAQLAAARERGEKLATALYSVTVTLGTFWNADQLGDVLAGVEGYAVRSDTLRAERDEARAYAEREADAARRRELLLLGDRDRLEIALAAAREDVRALAEALEAHVHEHDVEHGSDARECPAMEKTDAALARPGVVAAREGR